MMLPAMATCPPNNLTPYRLLADSRPFLELPTPFLCAIIYIFNYAIDSIFTLVNDCL